MRGCQIAVWLFVLIFVVFGILGSVEGEWAEAVGQYVGWILGAIALLIYLIVARLRR